MMGKKVLILGVAAVQMDAVSQLKKMGCDKRFQGEPQIH